jgi:multidrug efflux pump subunit AcrB
MDGGYLVIGVKDNLQEIVGTDTYNYDVQKARRGLGISGRIAAFFQSAQITPLLALVALLLGVFAVLVTPREEEPQINVTMANVLIPFPGASVRDVEQMVAIPAEQVLSQITGTEHVMSLSRPGMAVSRCSSRWACRAPRRWCGCTTRCNSNADWLPAGPGRAEPIIKPKGIDDVPIVSLTLFSKNAETGPLTWSAWRTAWSRPEARARHARSHHHRRPRPRGDGGDGPGPHGQRRRHRGRPAQRAAIGQPGPARGRAAGRQPAVAIESGPFLQASEVAELVVGVRGGKPVFLRDVAQVRDGAPPPSRYVWHGTAGENGGGEYPAVTIAITKKPGENAIDVANAVMARVEQLKQHRDSRRVQVAETRNYGATANDKAQKLIQKLLFATASVVALVFIALGGARPPSSARPWC